MPKGGHSDRKASKAIKLKIMGFIRAPKGVDFVIKSEPLTDKERQEISKFIADYKAKHRKKRRTIKSKDKHHAKISPNR